MQETSKKRARKLAVLSTAHRLRLDRAVQVGTPKRFYLFFEAARVQFQQPAIGLIGTVRPARSTTAS